MSVLLSFYTKLVVSLWEKILTNIFSTTFFITERILEENYHGLIKENETFVEITPVIKVDEEKVCRLEIVKKQKDIPFKV